MDLVLNEKNKVYQNNIDLIAKNIFYTFYVADNMSLPLNVTEEGFYIREMREKAEKFYAFFGDVDEAKKTIRFLNTIAPQGKNLVDSM